MKRDGMDQPLWRLIGWLSGLLEPQEAEAVLGDMAESGQNGLGALCDVCGLILRRQALLRRDVRVWGLLAVSVPLGILIAVAAQSVVHMGSVYAWLYFNNWDWRLFKNRGFWYALKDSAQSLSWQYLALACWSWCAGFVLGRIAKPMRTGLIGVVFVVALLFGAVVGAPQYLAFSGREMQDVLRLSGFPKQNDPLSASIFYRFVFPVLVQTIVVVIPSIWGMRQSAELEKLWPIFRKFVWMASIATFLAILIQTPGFLFLILVGTGIRPQAWHEWPAALQELMQFLHVIAYWPLLYLLKWILDRRRRSDGMAAMA